jgi:hypothetical protein
MGIEVDSFERIGLEKTGGTEETDPGLWNIVCRNFDAPKHASGIDKTPKYVTLSFDFKAGC